MPSTGTSSFVRYQPTVPRKTGIPRRPLIFVASGT